MLSSVAHIFLWIIFLYAGLSVLYLFLFSAAGRWFFPKAKATDHYQPLNRIAVMVPAYREDGIILSTAHNLLALDYPNELYDVYIIADSFEPQTLEALGALPLNVVEVSFEKSTKTKALNKAFGSIDKPYDIALICDADNMLGRSFLKKIDAAFQQGARAVQGRRVAKNVDTSFAILDACSEGINNHIFRRGANALGLSSSVIGSGMAFSYDTIKDILSRISAVGGFDKILQLKIVEQDTSILYLEDALIFDEKVDSSHAFEQQRKRWVSSQFIYLKQFFFPAIKKAMKGNWSYFNLAIANNLVLPRAFLIAGLPLLVLVGIIAGLNWAIAAVSILLLYVLTLLIAFPPMMLNRDFFGALLHIPKAVGVMMGTLVGMKKANKKFIHTVHTKTEITNPLFNEHAH